MGSRADPAEREFKELKLGQECAMKLAYHGSHDPLTNLVNRPEFENRLKGALQAVTTQGRQHVVMYLDLDQFKIVNDTCGHAAGDQLLRQVGALLEPKLRGSDLLGRPGRDAVCLLL